MEIPKEQMEQRLNFNGDPSNPHSHDNGNGFNHFQPLDSGYALNHSVPRPPRKRPWHHSNQGTSPDQVDSANNVKVYVAPVPRTATEAEGTRQRCVRRWRFQRSRWSRGSISTETLQTLILTTMATDSTTSNPSIRDTLLTIPFLALPANAPGTTPTKELLQLPQLCDFVLADQVDSANNVKVYVAPVPRTATEAEIRPVFEEHGTIVEVVLLKDKRTGVRQGSCFVKYATFDEADRAIKALNNQYTFVGESYPVVVKFADRELERLGARGFSRNMEKKDPLEVVADKVFVSCFNKEASKKEIEEIFSPYGHVEDIFIATSRGYAFVKFSNREMALAAIKGLNRTFTMRGCDHPLIVRFADPKKPRTGESRSNYLSVNANFGPCSQEPAVWPLPNFGDPNCGGSMLPIAPHHSSIPHPQVTTHMQNWEPGAPVVQHSFPPQQLHSQLGSMPFGSIQAPKLPSQSQPFITEVQRQPYPADSSVQNIEQHLSSQLASQTGSNPSTAAGNTPPDMPSSPQDEEFPECDWSEHYCPDGVKYYYNCVTCESRWEKPEEYALYEKESQKQPELEDNCCSLSQLSSCSSQQVAEKHQMNMMAFSAAVVPCAKWCTQMPVSFTPCYLSSLSWILLTVEVPVEYPEIMTFKSNG
ncbi:CUG-BP- and ETR3-like factor [Vigna unguiculata]|uniref:CUG-BP-and ETR3-like factor n=1 Tax=Vigna unguiculata TaxID=3917 RepID=A0A4D6MA75_VIGUN|nr:CUG-BP- and ETR3-like factor [Vigna unguiculata]